jgi:5-methylcytosine-specific restriction endonuclease McrA
MAFDRKEYDRQYRLKNLEKRRRQQREWYAANREHAISRIKAWAEENPEKRREYEARYREKNPGHTTRWRQRNPDKAQALNRADKLRRRAGRASGLCRAYAAILLGDPCSYCGGVGGQIDHIEPVARGGSNEWDNLTAACGGCNRRKFTASPLDHVHVGVKRVR